MVRDTGSHCFDVIIHTNPPSFSTFPMYQCNATLLCIVPNPLFTIPPPCFQSITRRRIKLNFIWHIPWSYTMQGIFFGTNIWEGPSYVYYVFGFLPRNQLILAMNIAPIQWIPKHVLLGDSRPVIEKEDCQSNGIDDGDDSKRNSVKEENFLLQFHLKRNLGEGNQNWWFLVQKCVYDMVNFKSKYFLAFTLQSFPNFSFVGHFVFLSLSDPTSASTLIIALKTMTQALREYRNNS